MPEAEGRVAIHRLTVARDEDGTYRYWITCSGADDNCRGWLPCPCSTGPAYDRDLFYELMLWEWDGEYHGVCHREIAGEWMRPTNLCMVVYDPYFPESADDLRADNDLAPGRYLVRPQWVADEFVELTLISETDLSTNALEGITG